MSPLRLNVPSILEPAVEVNRIGPEVLDPVVEFFDELHTVAAARRRTDHLHAEGQVARLEQFGHLRLVA